MKLIVVARLIGKKNYKMHIFPTHYFLCILVHLVRLNNAIKCVKDGNLPSPSGKK